MIHTVLKIFCKYLIPALLLAAILGLLYYRNPASAGKKLTILSVHQEGIRIEHSRAFKQWYLERYGQAIDIEWIDVGGTSAAIRYIKSSFIKQPEGIGIDIFFGGGVDPYVELKEAGLLESYRLPDPILSHVPADIAGIPIYDADYYWYGANLASFGILINKEVLKQMGLSRPERWSDLCDPQYFSWVGSGDLRESGTMHMMYEIILQAYGWERGFEILITMGSNTNHFTRSASQTAKDVTLGEAACGLAIDAYAYSQISQAPEGRMDFVLPADATIINPDSIALLKGAPSLPEAKRFIEFCLSEDGQKLWVFKPGAPQGPQEFPGGKMSVRTDIYENRAYYEYLNNKINPFKRPQSFQYDTVLGSARWDLINRLVGVMIIDDHKRLKKLWRKIIDAGLPRDVVKEFCKVPLSEQAVSELLEQEWKDPVRKEKIINQWIEFNRSKFKKIERRLRARSL